jgi:hypothetical protein
MSRLAKHTFLLALLPLWVQAESIALQDLGALSTEFTTVEQIESYSGRPLSALVDYRPGEAVSLVTPYRVQQITYLVETGETVDKGQAIAVMSGPEIHHFLTEFEVTQQRLEATKNRYESNRELYAKRAIDEARWIEITEAYYALQLEYEHMRHFRDLLSPASDSEDRITLNAPAAGILQYRQDSPGIDSSGELAQLIPADTLRMRVSVPITRRQGLASLESKNCHLEIDSVSGIASDFFVQAWSKPLNEQCQLLPGERLMVTPGYRFQGYRVPREAVFQWQNGPTVLLRRDDELVTVPVELLSGDASTYAVACPTDIAGGEVLSSSVSAVQGVLMGLGGE